MFISAKHYVSAQRRLDKHRAGLSSGVFQACLCYSALKIVAYAVFQPELQACIVCYSASKIVALLCQKLNSHIYDVSTQARPSLGVFQACICYSTLKILC